MSRPIKFRAWDKEVEEFADMDLVGLTCDGDKNIVQGWVFEEDGSHEVALQQFTGLLDKNGKEIYEGDVIEGNLFDDRLPTMGVIVYNPEYAHFANQNEGGLTPLPRIAQRKVIGNIYENPDLLTGGSSR